MLDGRPNWPSSHCNRMVNGLVCRHRAVLSAGYKRPVADFFHLYSLTIAASARVRESVSMLGRSLFVITVSVAGITSYGSNGDSRSNALARRMMPDSVCDQRLGASPDMWVARLCDTCDRPELRAWHDLCWWDDNWELGAPGTTGWDRLRQADYPLECVHPPIMVMHPPGVNPLRLPRHPGDWFVEQQWGCPFNYMCQQMVDDQLDAHVFCISRFVMRPQALAVDSFGILKPIDPTSIGEFYWPAGWHPRQIRRSSNRDREGTGQREHTLEFVLDRSVKHGSLSARIVDLNGSSDPEDLIDSFAATLVDAQGETKDLCSTERPARAIAAASMCFASAARDYVKGASLRFSIVFNLAALSVARKAALHLLVGVVDLDKSR